MQEAEDPACTTIAPALLAWFDTHGRHDLPWQQDRTPYRVWVSEVMLQQTQVATVIPYFQRFIARFPDIETLACASQDEVLYLWTGLGYYSRARNLHRAARLVASEHGGQIPEDIVALLKLPGIGRSTAGAILAQSRSQRHPIFDGNARRVLSRYFAVEGDPAAPTTQRRLWELADNCTPDDRVADYTQAIMDLGSSVCTRVRPLCEECPLSESCVARATGRQRALPTRSRRADRAQRQAWALVMRCGDSVLLEQRPDTGVWGGLWCFPLFESEAEALVWPRTALSLETAALEAKASIKHAFTHFDLTLHPLDVIVNADMVANLPEGYRWYDTRQPDRIGLPKPVKDLLYLQS